MDFAEEISAILEDYAEETANKIQDVIDEVSKEALDSLKSNPNIPVRTGKYRKGFYIKKRKKKDGSKYIIANRQYRLTHLLEKGHSINGGTGRTEAHPHWKQAQAIVDTIPDKIKEALT